MLRRTDGEDAGDMVADCFEQNQTYYNSQVFVLPLKTDVVNFVLTKSTDLWNHRLVSVMFKCRTTVVMEIQCCGLMGG